MKKLKLLVVTVFGLLLLTGCGEKTLTCTNSESSSGIDMGQEAVIKFKGEKVSYVKLTIDAKATSSLIKNNWSTFADTLGKQYTDKKATGIKVTTKNDSKNYTYKISIEVDVNKAKDDDLKDYSLDGIAEKTSTYKEVKESAEASGFKCK